MVNFRALPMIFREHHASYLASLMQQVTLPDSFQALMTHLLTLELDDAPAINPGTIEVVPYATGKSLVVLKDYGVLGYLSEASDL
jgi:hypothetical protein